jgi:acyl carrier protein
MDLLALATQASRELNVLTSDGRLHVDSFQMLDLMARLEQLSGIQVPGTALRRKWFETPATLAELLRQHVK